MSYLGCSLEIFSLVDGTESVRVASILNNLAELLRVQGKYQEAAPMFERTIRIFEAQYGKEHPTVAMALTNLAVLHRAQVL